MIATCRGARSGLIFVTILGAASAIAPGCGSNPDVSFDIALPGDVASAATWIEVGVFQSATCAALGPMLGGGVPAEGARTRVAFRVKDPPPAVGDLPKAKYAFAAVAKDATCGVLATGCTDTDVNDDRNIAIQLRAVMGGGTCTAGAVCAGARCVPGSDNSDPNVGAGCSLQLLGAGPLGNPLTGSGAIVSAPAISATANGFLIAYREYDQFAGAARLSVIPIDNGGGAAIAQTRTLESCQSVEEADATGMAFSDPNAGLIVMSRPACPPKPAGLDLLTIDATGAVVASGFEGRGEPARVLSNAHAIAWSPTLNQFLVTFTQQRVAQVALAPGNRLDQREAIAFGGLGPKTGGWVASTGSVVAFLSAGTGTGITPPPNPPDAGNEDLDGGEEAAAPPAPVDAGTSNAVLRLQVLSAREDIGTLPTITPAEFHGTWGSVAALGGRVITASDGASSSKLVSFRIFENGARTAVADGFSTEGLGKVTYADLAFHQDHLFFAVEKSLLPSSSSISLVMCDHATTTPSCMKKVYLPKDPRIPAMSTVRDGRVAVAASDTRVAVTWTTGRILTDKDPVGGYAIFACTTP